MRCFVCGVGNEERLSSPENSAAVPRPKGKRAAVRSALAFVVCLALLTLGVAELAGYFAQSWRTARTQDELQQIHENAESAPAQTPETARATTPAKAEAGVQTVQPDVAAEDGGRRSYQAVNSIMLHDLLALYTRNHDLCGWVTIQDAVDTAVVYLDNSFYLDHDFDCRKSASGTAFLDVNSPVLAETQNLTVYGHNMKDGSMFGHLVRYRSVLYWQQHLFVCFSTLWEKADYVIFAVLVTPTDSGQAAYVDFNSHPSFPNETAFDEYMQTLRKHSLVPWKVDVDYADALLTLSTCVGSDRMVLVARRLRAGETTQKMTELILL